MKRIILTFIMLLSIVGFLAAQNSSLWHTVQKGETLFGISKMYQTTVYQIKQDNAKIGKDFKIKVGQKLKVRHDQSLGSNYGKVIENKRYLSNNTSNSNETLSSTANTPEGKSPIVHSVSKGETLWSIAKNTYGIEIAQLKQWNSLNGNTIKEGQQLVVGYTEGIDAYQSTYATATYSQPVSNVSYSFDNKAANHYSSANATIGLSQEEIQQLPVFDPNWHKKEEAVQPIQQQENTKGFWDNGQPYKAPPQQPNYKVTRNNAYDNSGAHANVNPIIIKEADEQNAIYTTPVSNMNYKPAIGDNVTKKLANTKTKSLLESNELLKPSMAGTKSELRDIYNEMRFKNADKLEIKKDKGPAISFETSTPNSDLFILHRTLPVGTVVKLTNPVNDYTIYTKVAGKLPDTGENSRALLKMSNRAKEMLNARDAIFMIEIEYMVSKSGRLY